MRAAQLPRCTAVRPPLPVLHSRRSDGRHFATRRRVPLAIQTLLNYGHAYRSRESPRLKAARDVAQLITELLDRLSAAQLSRLLVASVASPGGASARRGAVAPASTSPSLPLSVAVLGSLEGGSSSGALLRGSDDSSRERVLSYLARQRLPELTLAARAALVCAFAAVGRSIGGRDATAAPAYADAIAAVFTGTTGRALSALKDAVDTGGGVPSAKARGSGLYELVFAGLPETHRLLILQHFAADAARRPAPGSPCRLVITDFDDTLVSSWVDTRYAEVGVVPGAPQFLAEVMGRGTGLPGPDAGVAAATAAAVERGTTDSAERQGGAAAAGLAPGWWAALYGSQAVTVPRMFDPEVGDAAAEENTPHPACVSHLDAAAPPLSGSRQELTGIEQAGRSTLRPTATSLQDRWRQARRRARVNWDLLLAVRRGGITGTAALTLRGLAPLSVPIGPAASGPSISSWSGAAYMQRLRDRLVARSLSVRQRASLSFRASRLLMRQQGLLMRQQAQAAVHRLQAGGYLRGDAEPTKLAAGLRAQRGLSASSVNPTGPAAVDDVGDAAPRGAVDATEVETRGVDRSDAGRDATEVLRNAVTAVLEGWAGAGANPDLDSVPTTPSSACDPPEEHPFPVPSSLFVISARPGDPGGAVRRRAAQAVVRALSQGGGEGASGLNGGAPPAPHGTTGATGVSSPAIPAAGPPPAAVPPVHVLLGTFVRAMSTAGMIAGKTDHAVSLGMLWPEADILIVGDSGQGDAAVAVAARRMLQRSWRAESSGCARGAAPGSSSSSQVRAIFMHDVTPHSPRTGDGGSKAEYAAGGVVFFSTYAGAALAAWRMGLLAQPALLRIADATVIATLRMADKGWSGWREGGGVDPGASSAAAGQRAERDTVPVVGAASIASDGSPTGTDDEPEEAPMRAPSVGPELLLKLLARDLEALLSAVCTEDLGTHRRQLLQSRQDWARLLASDQSPATPGTP